MITKKRQGELSADKTLKKPKRTESSSFQHHGLSKNIWMYIITFLETKEILSTLTTLNKFFYSCIKESPRMLQTVQIALNLQKSSKTQKTMIFPEQALSYLRAAENIDRLTLLIRNEGITPTLTQLNPLVKILPSMPWAENLLVLDLTILHFNHLVIKTFLSSLKSLKDLSLTLGWGFPMLIYDLIGMFLDKEESKRNPVFSNYFRPLQKIKVVYLGLCIGSVHDIKLFDVLDKNQELQSFYLEFKSKVSILTSCVPALKTNKSLNALRLPSAFAFASDTSKNFLEYLKNNEKLESLEISETLMANYECFLEMISINKQLKSLSLLPYIPDAGFSVYFSQIIEIVESLESSNFQQFLWNTECLDISLNDEPKEGTYSCQELACKTYEKIRNSFERNQKLQKLLIKFENISQVFVSAFKKVARDLPEDCQGSLILMFEKTKNERI